MFFSLQTTTHPRLSRVLIPVLLVATVFTAAGVGVSRQWLGQMGRCGDSIVVGSEQCDDGNANNHDGCSTGCDILTGWACAESPSVCRQSCGDGVVALDYETCDDGNNADGDGCTRTCTTEKGWSCDAATGHCRCVTTARECGLASCGDGKLDPGEECDDGIIPRVYACNPNCSLKVGYVCSGKVGSIPICSRDIEVVLQERKLKTGVQ